eukprot:5738939-Prymnesium_polylepis.1
MRVDRVHRRRRSAGQVGCVDHLSPSEGSTVLEAEPSEANVRNAFERRQDHVRLEIEPAEAQHGARVAAYTSVRRAAR